MEQKIDIAEEYDLTLTDLIDVETLQKIQDAFADMAGTAALTTDINGVAVTQGSNFTDFCMRYTRPSDVGRARCEQCDHLGAEIALKEGRSLVYPCHAGLLDFAAPIMANGKMVGCFIGGQVLTEKPDPDKIRQVAKEIGVDPDEYWEAVEKVNIVPHKALKRATDSLFTIANVLSDLAYSKYLMYHANEELKRATSMKSDFLANMSHEIRTPMNAVIGMAEIALREDLSPSARDCINQIKSAGKSLLTIINDILDFSKIESGKMDINTVDYEPMSMINDVANIVVTRLEDKDVELILNVAPNLPHKLIGDNIRIKQVLLNLANNAAKFTHHGRIVLSVDFESTGERELELQVSVKDTGIGIKKEDLDKLFQSFKQVDSKRNRNIEGTGLGLAISKQLVELMNGGIKVESEYEKGSTFSFTIPQEIIDNTPSANVNDPDNILIAGLIANDFVRDRLKGDIEKLGIDYRTMHTVSDIKDLPIDSKKVYLFVDRPMFSDPVEEFVRSHPNMKAVLLIKFNDAVKHDLPNLTVLKKPLFILNIATILNGEELHNDSNRTDWMDSDFIAPDAKILIVDDNAINLTVAEGLLESLKMQIDTAVSGKLALEMIDEKHYDIIFMDHMMPELDGVETTHLIRRFHSDYNDVPIIALTANAVDGTKEMFINEGMNDFVAKPIELKVILSKLKTWLPKEKILKRKNLPVGNNQSDTKPQAQAENSASISIEGLNVETAMKLLGNEKLFWAVLKEYYRVIDKKYNLIKEYEQKEQWKEYTIEVHALKSSSRQIGALELAAVAERMEKAGNAKDAALIHETTPSMLESYYKYKGILTPYFEEQSGEQNGKQAEKNDLQDFFTQMKEALDNLDMDAMEEVVKSMNQYSYDGDQKKLFDDLKNAVEDIDTEKCEEVLSEWEKLL